MTGLRSDASVRRIGRLDVESEVERLKMRHNKLEVDISREAARPLPDWIALSALKRRKLALKDRIAGLMRARIQSGWWAGR